MIRDITLSGAEEAIARRIKDIELLLKGPNRHLSESMIKRLNAEKQSLEKELE